MPLLTQENVQFLAFVFTQYSMSSKGYTDFSNFTNT